MSSIVTPVFSQSEQVSHLAGVDIAQLLRNIGEASASSSSTTLFGLLLNAQQVLAQLQSSAAPIRTPHEAALSATCRAMNDAGQDLLIGYARELQKDFPRRRVDITLVTRRQAQGGGGRMKSVPTTNKVVTLSDDEAAMLAVFRSADDCSRIDMLAMMSAIAERFQRERPVLTLVKGGQRERST